ncbi:MAG TPA: ABC transporter substrate-binding protein [Actinomycetota bacterium]|nr:ABC transporter substrate-binding protein [Actinomycetota bacterium]
MAYPEEPSSLVPIEASDPAADVLRAVLPSFHSIGPDLRYRPSLLAAEPEVLTDGTHQEVRFRLRPWRWSDGRPITVRDVAFTWQTMRDAGVREFEAVHDVLEEGPRMGRLILDPPYAGWTELFSAGRFVLPAHTDIDPKEWRDGPPVSGGPFSVEAWDRGRSISLARNPRFRPNAPVERIVLDLVPDPTTAVQLFEAGEVDVVAPMLGVSWGRRLARVGGARVTRAFGAEGVHLLFNTKRVAIGDRRRIANAFDRMRFAEVILRDEGRRLDGVLSPEQPGAVGAWAGYGSKPERVRGRELTLIYPESELLEVLARAFQLAVARMGGDLELVALDNSVFRREALPGGDFDLAFWNPRSGPAAPIGRWFRTNGSANFSGLSDDVVDTLVQVADSGGPQGSTALLQAQERLAERLPVLPLFQPRIAMAARGVRGPEANPSIDGPLWNAGRWVLAR